jgi:hypothetical protein
MSERTPEQILAEWRECERSYAVASSPELARRIEQLRIEHADAVHDRRDEAEELADLSPARSS